MRGFLLDTNHIGAMARQEPKVMARLSSIPPEHLVRICAITLGEIEAGNLITNTTDQLKRDAFIAYVYKEFLPYAIEIRGTTRIYYAEIIERIWLNHPPPPEKDTEKHLVALGVDINDIWTAAVAFEHKLVFVTNDKMTCIREALKSDDDNPDVVFDNWL